MIIHTSDELADLRADGRKTLLASTARVMVGMASCGLASGARQVYDALRAQVSEQELAMDILLTGCRGACYLEPLIDVVLPGQARVTYAQVTADDIADLLAATTEGRVYAKRAIGWAAAEPFLLDNEDIPYGSIRQLVQEAIPELASLPFFHGQMSIAMRNCGFIDPTSIDEYIAKGGYAAAAKALTSMEPETIIAEITASGLRGRGGGGFPTGRKWETARKAHGEPRYVICNADEGDPGAYMDRSIIESDPHSIIEGMIIGAYAIGAKQGYIYVREEYPLAVERLRLALRQAEAYGLLGNDLFGTGFDFTIQINRGAGAFICGESTALMASLEGRVGEPRAKYIHSVESGLWGKPSCLNNVETWNNVPIIIQRGANWFAGIGTEGSKGTKVFSLVGKVNNVGLVEVPMGITLRQVIEDMGGGVAEGKKLKAVQTGGPSGGCIPEEHLDLPVDYESLAAVGAMMGSGGMIVMDESTCMVDVARYFLAFLKDESCGKCTPCRDGTARMLDILTGICEGRGQIGDLDLLRDLAAVMADGALCALGTSAPNPVLTTLEHFADEYRAHIEEHRCPAKVCRGLISYEILPNNCAGCGLCAKSCPNGAITGKPKEPYAIDQDTCSRCGLCVDACRFAAIEVR